MLALWYPKEFWLSLTNSVLGTILLILLALVIIGLVLDSYRKLRMRRPSLSEDVLAGFVERGKSPDDREDQPVEVDELHDIHGRILNRSGL
jgi:hypothetical protein